MLLKITCWNACFHWPNPVDVGPTDKSGDCMRGASLQTAMPHAPLGSCFHECARFVQLQAPTNVHYVPFRLTGSSSKSKAAKVK